ncbi:MAG: XylR family transcriptional regulator [Planctomyces sp.]|nr:XylR family transcriptional regulator [Planctomyces sp.]
MRHVALLVETSRTYGRGLLRGVHRYVTEHEPWSMYLELRALDSRAPAWLSRWKGDGILTRTSSATMAQAISRVGVPTVELRATKLNTPFPFVGVDNVALGEMVADHLLERGFRHFGVYELDVEDYFAERRETFISAIARAGYGVDIFRAPHHREHPREWERHQDLLVKWLLSLPKPVGLMACTDQLGYWLLDACQRAGIPVPEQAAVVGAENDETLCTMTTPPLSSVCYDAEGIGYQAARLLDLWMRGHEPARDSLLIPPLGVVSRQSSDVMAIDDPEVANAVRFIREHACQGIDVAAVLKRIPLSRSTLERKMRAILGRSPKEEILRVQLASARRLLIETELSLEMVASRTGFSSPQYFCTAFRGAEGCTPGFFRRQQRLR